MPAQKMLATARALAKAVSGGGATQAQADRAMQLHLRDQSSQVESQARELGISPAEIVERTLKMAHNTLRGGRIYVISTTIRRYLEERTPHVTNQTLEQKAKQLGELADWVGTGSQVSTLTREHAGRYVHEVLLHRGKR